MNKKLTLAELAEQSGMTHSDCAKALRYVLENNSLYLKDMPLEPEKFGQPPWMNQLEGPQADVAMKTRDVLNYDAEWNRIA